MAEQEVKKPKAVITRNVKICTVQFLGKRYAINPDSLKTMSAFFHMTGTFTIDPNKKYSGWSLTKIIAPKRFTWDTTFTMRTRVYLHDDAQQTIPLDPTTPMENGVNFEITEPKRINAKEAQELINAGAIVVELDEEDRIKSGAIVKFSSH